MGAQTMIDISKGFKGTFLSNMFPCVVPYNTGIYKCSEAAYMAAKTLDLEARRPFEQMNGYEAKAAGKLLELRPNWDKIKFNIMLDIVESKFKPVIMADALLRTEDKLLVEFVDWHDNYWGDCICGKPKCAPRGENNLGRILMMVRSSIRNRREIERRANYDN